MKRPKQYLTHFVAECRDCEFVTQDYIHGPKLASSHARAKGHVVHAEKGYCIEYGGTNRTTTK